MNSHYWPAESGGWLALAVPGRVLLIEDYQDAQTLAALWSIVKAGGSHTRLD